MENIVSYDQVQKLRENPEQFAKLIYSVLNTMGNGEFIKETVDVICHRTHRTQQQVIMGMMIGMIYQWSEDFKNKNYDLRNEATCKLCNKIWEAFANDMWLPFI